MQYEHACYHVGYEALRAEAYDQGYDAYACYYRCDIDAQYRKHAAEDDYGSYVLEHVCNYGCNCLSPAVLRLGKAQEIDYQAFDEDRRGYPEQHAEYVGRIQMDARALGDGVPELGEEADPPQDDGDDTEDRDLYYRIVFLHGSFLPETENCIDTNYYIIEERSIKPIFCLRRTVIYGFFMLSMRRFVQAVRGVLLFFRRRLY